MQIITPPLVVAFLLALPSCLHAAPREALPWKTPAGLADAVELPAPSAVHLEGFLGLRAANNEANRLAKVDEAPLLAGFQHRPGSHPWIGEHVGKWLHASVLAWSYTGDEDLRRKIDRVAAELIKCQEPDGYLGTYTPDKRFGLYEGADWDVWSHKYNLLGLLTYYQYTGDEAALACCRRMGDLLVTTFGPGGKSILSAGTHMGMAATSVLEPIVLLYRATGDSRYLVFARQLVASYDLPNGPRIIASLLKEKSVARTANGKAYEMLSNLVGLCELARATGDRALLNPVLIAWQDIVDNRLYLTGSASQGEHFRGDHELPNQQGANVSETCVTTTWIQLNSQLLRLTGEARFGTELEKTFLNHLAAAQRPDGAQWCYFTSLEGTKPYGPGINCCVSSGPRGMALVPPHAFLRKPGNTTSPDLALVNLMEASRAGLTLDQQNVILEHTPDPASPGKRTITVRCERPARFALGIRTPDWARPLTLTTPLPGDRAYLKDGWTILPPRIWKDGDQARIESELTGRLIPGSHGNPGRAALAWGPAILAYDEAFNPRLGPPNLIALADPGDEPPVVVRSVPDGGALFEARVRSARLPGVHKAVFVLFADAGAEGSRFQVWLRGPGVPFPKLTPGLDNARELRSEPGNADGSILDNDPETYVVTFNGQPQTSAWFGVELGKPLKIRKVAFAHGRTFHDGGWFDTSSGKPVIEAKRTADGPWETVGTLSGYPTTTASNPANLQTGMAFEAQLAKPGRFIAVRVTGKPASGDAPRQAFASCAELRLVPD